MKENIYEGSSIMTIVGVILIFLLFSLYRYLYPKVQKSENLVTLAGRLSQIPRYESNGENPNYILIRLTSDRTKYEINGCGLNAVNDSKLYNLGVGDSVVLVVDKDDYRNRDGFINASVTVLELKQPNDEAILSIDMLNECEKYGWRKFVWLTLVVVAIALVFKGKAIWTFVSRTIRSFRS